MGIRKKTRVAKRNGLATEQSSARRLATEKPNDTVRAEGNNTEGNPVDMGD